MEQIMDGQATTITTKPRKGFIAFGLSLLIPGLGQVYNGQPKKAILFFGLLMLIPWLFSLTHATTFFYGLMTLFMVEIALRIYIIIDGVKHARRQKDYVLKSYNTWYAHLFIAVCMMTILLIYDVKTVLGIQTFKLPAHSNSPTLQFGDWIVADMKAYKNNEPDYGDIVAYSEPNGQFRIFRVVGRPNDSIELVDNIVSVNGKLSKATFIKETIHEDVPVVELEEELPNGHKHLIYKVKVPFDSTKTNIKNIVVPSYSYYLLGDNRDYAADSRYGGFIHKDSIKGRIVCSYWGQTGMDRMNIDFTDK